MTPQEIAARLRNVADGPHDDQATIALAETVAEAIRALVYATRDPAGLSEPATVYAVVGQLAAATSRLPQIFFQLTRWLTKESATGRLAQDDNSLPSALFDILSGLDSQARPCAALLADALYRVQRAAAGLSGPSEGGEGQ